MRDLPPIDLKEPQDDGPEMAPPDALDPVLEAYKRDVDRSLLRVNLKLTPQERGEKLVRFARFIEGLATAGRRAREADPAWGLK